MSRRAAAAGGGSVASTGSVAVSVVEQILGEKGIEIGSDEELGSDIGEQAKVVAASAEAIDAAIGQVEPSRQWQEIVALIKVYGGWAGAALAVAINSYLITNKGTIQDLITVLPGMLFRILSDPAIPGNVGYVAGTAVKATAAIVFMRALISYLSANSSTIFDDVAKANVAFIQAMEKLNPPIEKGGISEEVLAELRRNQLNFTTWNITGKTKTIVDTALNPSAWKAALEKIQILSKIPFTYLREARTVLATYAIGAVGNLQDYVANRGDLFSIDSSESGSINSHNSLWKKLLQEGADQPLLGEPAAGGGGPAEKQVPLEEASIQAKVLQVELQPDEVAGIEKAINDEIGNVLVEGGAGGGSVLLPGAVFINTSSEPLSQLTASRDPSQELNYDAVGAVAGAGAGGDMPVDGDDVGPGGAVASNVTAKTKRSSSQPNPFDSTVIPELRSSEKKIRTGVNGTERPGVEQRGFSLPGGGKKRNSKRKTKKAKRTKKRSKKSSKRKTRR